MKKQIFVIISIICLILTVPMLFANGQQEGGESIKVGFYGPLTGPMSLSGEASKFGAELAIEQINAAGGVLGKELVMVPYDDKSSPEQAVKVVTRMIEADKVNIIVGSLHSGNILASGPVGEKREVPQIGIGTSPVWLQKGYEYLFRPLPNTGVINVQIVKTIKDLGYKKVGGFGRSDEYGKVGIEDIKAQLEAIGIEMVIEWFQPGDQDFTGQLTKLVSQDIDALVSYGVDVDQGPILKQTRQAGFNGLVFGPESLSVPSVIEVAGADANGAVFGSPYIIPAAPEDSINQLHEDFFTGYSDKYGEMPASACAMRTYDAVNLFAKAMKDAGSIEGPAVQKVLSELNGVEGLAGVFDFRGNNGEGMTETRMFAIKDGKYILLEEYLKSN